ncbi:MAG: N-carbamoylputrescine amidase [Acidimicrobiales bacterium]|nr:N-carbamoylputrescine amidase [Acidimicrobiales bacterium]
MSRLLTVAAVQCAMLDDVDTNVAEVERLVREAAGRGAGLVVTPELFERPYWCKDQDPAYFGLARPLRGHPTVARFAALAAELAVVVPVSVYERDGQATFNTLVMIDADGTVLGRYRKSHIPDGPGYQEKYYFNPGDSGFVVWRTAAGVIGGAVCWDQWFPEVARCLVLDGAELLLYPTAIGSEPPDPTVDTSGHWQRVMCGHAGANLVPLVAANRHGREVGASCEVTFYGSSFIADQTGAIVAGAARDRTEVITATFDLDAVARQRTAWGVFRDRRPELYGRLSRP